MANPGFARNPFDVLACAILDEGLPFKIEVEVPGWGEGVAVPSPAMPGAVRRAVEKVLRDLGLSAVSRPTRPLFF